MGVYFRRFRKTGRRIWWLNYMVGGRQVFESSHSTSKRFAESLLAIRKADVAAGRYEMLKPSPRLGEWAENYLEGVGHPNTRKRYTVSKTNLIRFFGEETLLNGITASRINEFSRIRRDEKAKAATINRDLRFLAQILKQAERERFLNRSPFDIGRYFQNESKDRRKALILSLEEQEKLLAVAPPRIRLLTVLGVETGMRTGEMLSLKWCEVNFLENTIQIVRSKTESGLRLVPLSSFCKAEFVRWRSLIGPDHSEWVFPSLENRRSKLQGGRKAWANALKKANLIFRPIYYLRHTFASRMTAAGVSPLTIAQMLGHASTRVVPRYAQVLDSNRLDAMKRLEAFRQSVRSQESTSHEASAQSGEPEVRQ